MKFTSAVLVAVAALAHKSDAARGAMGERPDTPDRRLKMGKKSNSIEKDIFAPAAPGGHNMPPTSPSPAPGVSTPYPTPGHPVSGSGEHTGGKKSSSSMKITKKPKHESRSMSMSEKGKGMSEMGKGKGKGGVIPTPPPNSPPTTAPPNSSPTLMPVPSLGCQSMVARRLSDMVPEIITQNPAECCMRVGPTAVYVTHAQSDPSTESGFEPFWDDIFFAIADISKRTGTCFVMTGYSQDFSPSRDISRVLEDTIVATSLISDVPSMMVTDPTEDVSLINSIRSVSSNSALPSIGVFNTGHPNIIVEAIVSGLPRLPYVGVLRDSDYGRLAAEATEDLLDGVRPIPLCFNARPDLDIVGIRCATYYDQLTDETISPETGVTCDSNTPVATFVSQIRAADANAVFAHLDCCEGVAAAADQLRGEGRTVIVGCSDEEPGTAGVNFVTTQPVQLEAYQASSWANLPVQIAEEGENGRGEQYFPSLQSLVNTGIFNVINE